jgi:hypothetical protein
MPFVLRLVRRARAQKTIAVSRWHTDANPAWAWSFTGTFEIVLRKRPAGQRHRSGAPTLFKRTDKFTHEPARF